MAETLEGIDLSWVIFSDEESGQQCFVKGCNAEALYIGVFKKISGTCPHGGTKHYCMSHRDAVLRAARIYLGLFRCPKCPGSMFHLLRLEPIG